MDISQEKLMSKGNKYYSWTYMFLWALLGISGLALVFSGLQGNWLLGAGGVGLLFSGILIALLYKTRKAVIAIKDGTIKSLTDKDQDRLIPFFLDKLKALNLKTLTFLQLTDPVIDRITSLKTLVNSVFLKQIRSHLYKDIYASYQWKHRRISNLIYELSEDDFMDSQNMGKARKYGPWPEDRARDKKSLDDQHKKDLMTKILGNKIPGVAGEAKEFGTNLWFTPKDKEAETLKDLITTGQFTMCYNLIHYINEIRHTPDAEKDLSQNEKDAIDKHRHQAASGYTKLTQAEKEAIDKLRDQPNGDYKQLTQAEKEVVDKGRHQSSSDYKTLSPEEQELINKLRRVC